MKLNNNMLFPVGMELLPVYIIYLKHTGNCNIHVETRISYQKNLNILSQFAQWSLSC